MNKYEIIIKADTNDADYITSITKISEDEIELIKPLIKQIKKFKKYKTVYNKIDFWHTSNFPTRDLIREDLGQLSAREYYTEKGISEESFDFFENICPNNEYGFHTIESIIIQPITEKERLL